MTITAQSLIAQAQELLQDLTGTRWSATELVAHLNDGQRALVDLRPEEFAITAPLALVVGPKQTVPTACAKLLEIPRNTNGAVIRPVERKQLDAIEPSWYTKPGAVTIQHTTVDAREPSRFYVYPPAALGASVDLVYAAYPTDIAAATGPLAANVTGNLQCPDAYKNALLHWVLARAFMKDAEFGGNAAMSAGHLQLFSAGAGSPEPTVADKE